MAGDSDAIFQKGTTFEKVTSDLCDIPVDKFISTAWDGLRCLEPWNQGSGDHPLVKGSVTLLKQHFSKYMDALESSANVLDDGYTVCCEAQTLCDELPAKNFTDDEIMEFVDDMKKFAEKARVRAEVARTEFMDVREGLLSVSQKMEGDIKQIEKEKVESEQFHDLAVKKKDRVNTVVNLYRFVNLPTMLPIFDVVFDSAEKAMTRGVRKEISKRDKEMITYGQALDTLRNATHFTSGLITQVDEIIRWWSNMSTALTGIGTSVKSLRAGASKMRLKHVGKKWKECEERYAAAKEQLALFKHSQNNKAKASNITN